MTDLQQHYDRIPVLASASSISATRLAGLTNINYLVVADGENYVMRVPGAGTSEYIDRRAEHVAARSAAAAGVNAPVVFLDPNDGLMVTRFLADAATMSSERFTNLDAVRRAGRAFRRLHDTAEPFAVDFKLFDMIDEYKALLASKNATLPAGYNDVQAMATAAQTALEMHPVTLAPSHCDPLCENFLDTGETMFIIDYEYSGNNDPMWDLGDLSVEGRFNTEQDAVLLAAYFDGQPPAPQVARMMIYKAMCDLLWTLWGVIQHANGNPAEDFWAYATKRFYRCQTLMNSEKFSNSISVLANS